MLSERFQVKKGYTLIELMLAVSIVGLLGLIIVPKTVNFLPDFNLEGEARKMMAKIREAQQLSIAKRELYQLEFDSDLEQYLIRYVATPQPVIVETVRLGGNIEIQSTTFSQNTVEFNFFGAPDAGGDIVLMNSKGQTMTVSITPATGRVTIQ